MERNKRDFYREIAEKNTNDIKTIKTTRTGTSGYRVNKYKTDTKGGILHKSKLFIQTLTMLSVVGGIYLLTRNNSEIARNILEKSKAVLSNNINIEVFEQKIDTIKENFNLQSSSVPSTSNEIYIDEEEIEKMEEDLEKSPKN